MFDFLNQQPIPDNFDYKRKKREIEQKAEIARQLQGFRPSQLQLMPGGYTAGGLTNPLSTIATIAANVAGAKLLSNSQKESDALDDASNKLYREGIQALKDVRDNPTEAEKNAASDVRDLSYFANDPLVPYDIKDKSAAPAQTSPVPASAVVEAKPLEPVKTPAPARGRALPRATSTGSGRGVQGGPTAAELAANNAITNNAARIDAQNLQSPMQVFPSNDIGNGIPSPYLAGRTTAGQTFGDNIGRDEIGPGGNLTPQQIERMAQQGADTPMKVFKNETGQFLGRNMGIDEIGASQMTPSQIEAQVRDSSKPYVPPESVLPAGTAARQAQTAGAGRGVQGGPSTADLAAVRQQVEQAAARQAEIDRQVELDTLGQQYRTDNQQELANFAQRKGKVLAKSIQDRTEEAKTMLARSGDRGQKLVDAMDTAMLNNLLSPEDDRKNLMVVGDRLYNVKTKQFVNDGKPQVFKEGDYIQTDNGLVRVGGGAAGKKIKAHFDTPEGMKVLYEDGTTKLVDQNSTGAKDAAQDETDKVLSGDKKKQIASGIADMVKNVIDSGDVDRAGAGVWNTAGNYLNKTIGAQSNTAEARSRIDALKSKMAEHILTKFADTGMSPNKLADTKRELDLHIASVGNFDYERLSPKSLKIELNKIAQQMMVVATQHPYKAAELGAGRTQQVNTQRSPSRLVW